VDVTCLGVFSGEEEVFVFLIICPWIWARGDVLNTALDVLHLHTVVLILKMILDDSPARCGRSGKCGAKSLELD
jgi:hypothetical protein